jgi:hypothetical protein
LVLLSDSSPTVERATVGGTSKEEVRMDRTQALAYTRQLLAYAQDPPYLLDETDKGDLENLVAVLESITGLPRVALVRPWEGDEAVTVNGVIVHRFPDDGPFPQTASSLAEALTKALEVQVEEIDLAGHVEDWDQVAAVLAANHGKAGDV